MPGPDHQFLLGIAMKPWDKGGLNVAIAVTKHPPTVMLDFGTQVNRLASTPLDTESIISTLRLKIYGTFGEMDYTPVGFPLVVIADTKAGIVETRLPEPANVLIANPELFLVWADKLEEAVREIQPRNWRVA